MSTTRNQQIAECRRSGQSFRTIAEVYGLSPARVQQIVQAQERRARYLQAVGAGTSDDVLYTELTLRTYAVLRRRWRGWRRGDPPDVVAERLSRTPDEELLGIHMLGPRMLAEIRAAFPYQPTRSDSHVGFAPEP